MGFIQSLMSLLKLPPQETARWVSLLADLGYLAAYSDDEINEEEALFLFIFGSGDGEPLEEPIGFAAKLKQEKKYDTIRAALEAKGFTSAAEEILERLKGMVRSLPEEQKQPVSEALLLMVLGVSSIDKRLSSEEEAFARSLAEVLRISSERFEQHWKETKEKLAPHRLLIEHLIEVYLFLMSARSRAEDEMMLVSEKLERFPKALTDIAVQIATEQQLDSPGAVGFFIGLLGGLEGGDAGLAKVGVTLSELIVAYQAAHQLQGSRERLPAIQKSIEDILARDASLKDNLKGFMIGLISSMERFTDAQRKLLKGGIAEALGVDMKELEMITILLKSSEPHLYKNFFG
jgi:hypothetical protein